MKDKILAIKQQADSLRSDLRSLRRLQQINKESIVETVDEAWKKIRVSTGMIFYKITYYPPTKSEGYSFGIVRVSVCLSVRPFRPSVHTICLSGTKSQYLLVRFDSFLVQMISTMDSRYPISLVKIDPLTLELLPLF